MVDAEPFLSAEMRAVFVALRAQDERITHLEKGLADMSERSQKLTDAVTGVTNQVNTLTGQINADIKAHEVDANNIAELTRQLEGIKASSADDQAAIDAAVQALNTLQGASGGAGGTSDTSGTAASSGGDSGATVA